MPGLTPNIWAIVPTCNRPGPVMQCLEALRAQTAPLAGIVLVDNASSSGIGDQVLRQFGGLTVLRMSENLGPAGGFAAGMRAAMERGAGWVWLMDDDARPLPDALEALVTTAEFSHPGVAALSSLKQDVAGNLQKWEALVSGTSTRLPDAASYARESFDIDAAAFAGLLVRSSVLTTAGVPDARYFSWFADYEFCLRLRASGRIVCVPASRLIHDDDASRGLRSVAGRLRPGPAVFVKLCTGLRNRAYYFSRHRGWTRTLPDVAVRFTRMAAGIVLWDDRKAFRLQLLARAFSDGLRGRLGPFPSS